MMICLKRWRLSSRPQPRHVLKYTWKHGACDFFIFASLSGWKGCKSTNEPCLSVPRWHNGRDVDVTRGYSAQENPELLNYSNRDGRTVSSYSHQWWQFSSARFRNGASFRNNHPLTNDPHLNSGKYCYSTGDWLVSQLFWYQLLENSPREVLLQGAQ